MGAKSEPNGDDSGMVIGDEAVVLAVVSRTLERAGQWA
jgi:hypothetical protein